MSNLFNHRMTNPANARFIELLEAIKTEFESITNEAGHIQRQRDEYEQRIQNQINEFTSIQQTIYDLERSQQKVHQQYQEEIARLRHQLDQRGGHSSSLHPSHPPTAPPNIGLVQANLFSGIMSGGSQNNLAPLQMNENSHHPNYPPPPSHAAGPSPYMNGSSTPQPPPNKRIRADSDTNTHPGQPPAQPTPVFNGPMSTPPLANQPPSQIPMLSQQSQSLMNYPTNNGIGQTQNKSNNKLPKINQPAPNQTPPSLNPHVDQQHNLPQAPPLPPSTPQQTVKRKTSGSNQQATVRTPKPSGPPSGAVLNDMDPDTVPAQYRREGSDWFAIFNPKLPRALSVDLLHSLDHNSVVCCVRFSADGKFLATGCNHTAQIFDVTSGNQLSILSDENVPRERDCYIRSVCFSPDGKFLVTGAEDKQIRIWDISKSRIRQVLTGHEQDIYSLDFSRDGRFIVSGSGDRTTRLWDFETGKCLHTLSVDDVGPKDAGVTSVAISPDGAYVAAGSLDKIVRVWDSKSGYLIERMEGHKDSVYSVAFTPDGQYLISGSLDRNLKLWEIQTSRSYTSKPNPCKTSFVGHKDFVLSVASSPDGNWIVSGSKDRTVQFWDPRTAQTQFMLQGHKNSVISVALSPVDKVFATGSGDHRARIWSYENIKSEI